MFYDIDVLLKLSVVEYLLLEYKYAAVGKLSTPRLWMWRQGDVVQKTNQATNAAEFFAMAIDLRFKSKSFSK